MPYSTPRRTPIVLITCLLAACGQSESPGAQTPGVTPPTQSDNSATNPQAVQEQVEEFVEAFVPEADQFGVKQFKIVYRLKGQENGTRTMWVEDYGRRVALEDKIKVFNMDQNKLVYWDGEKSHLKNLPDGETFTTGIRTKTTEPSSFATTSASDLELVGYKRIGDKNILGETCEHWINETLTYEGCRWNRIDLEFKVGVGTAKIVQSSVATEYVEGEGIPDRIKSQVN